MKFRTELNILPSTFKINHQSKIMAMGSCFVDNVGNRLKDLKFKIDINPFGIIFNPYSIAKLLDEHSEFNTDFVERDGTFYGFDFHSKFNAKSKKALLTKINSTNKKTSQSLLNANVLMLTFGTAWVYQQKTSTQVVSNCHKVPQQHFIKRLLNLEHLKKTYTTLFKNILSSNSTLKIVLTVSPVRHLKDGFIENNQSKAVLLLLCRYLADEFPNQVIYFPAYEIVMDDLRDYRFYKQDLIHPNRQAIDYIFEKFSATFFDKETIDVLPKIMQLNALKQHQFFNANEQQIKHHQSKIIELENYINSTIH